jgi:hypothetical protein
MAIYRNSRGSSENKLNCIKCRVLLNEFEEKSGVCGYCLVDIKAKRRRFWKEDFHVNYKQ